MAAPAPPEGLNVRHIVMLRSADASAPAVPTGLRLSGNALTWDASADPYSGATGASGLKEYVLTRDGIFLAAVPTTPGLSIELTGQDIGTPSPPGSDAQAGASHSLTSAGERIYFTSDQFRFKFGAVTGDCSIIARITAFAPSALGFAKASLMFRESTGVGSACVHLMQYSNGSVQGTKVEYRPTTSATMLDGTSVPAGTLPQWLKLTRVGNVFTGFYSYDGNNWQDNGSVTVALPATALVGLALCSEVIGTPVSATFTDVAVTNSPVASYVDTGLVGTPVYRVAARDNAGNTSAFGAPATTAAATSLPPFPTAPATRTVNRSVAVGGTNYHTITAAISAAVSGANEVITVAPGTYVETLLITKASLTIRAADPLNRPLIDGQNTLPIGWAASGNAPGSASLCSIAANNVWIDSIDFFNSRENALTLGPANNNANFLVDLNEWYSNITVLRCNITRTRGVAIRTMNVDGSYIGGNFIREAQWQYTTGGGNTLPTSDPVGFGMAVNLMGRNCSFIDNTITQVYGEGVHAGHHISFKGLNATEAHIQLAGLTMRGNVISDTWSALLYVTNVREFPNGDPTVIERNLFFRTEDKQFFHDLSQPAADRQSYQCVDFGSESGTPSVGGAMPSDGFAGSRNIRFRNNVIVGGRVGILFSNWAGTDFNNIAIENNTVYTFTHRYGLDGCISNDNTATRNITLRNNLFYDADARMVASVYDFGTAAGWRTWKPFIGTTVWQTNLWSHTPNSEAIGGAPQGSIIAGPSDIINVNVGLTAPLTIPLAPWPSFPTFDTNGFRLTASSPAIGAGTPVSGLVNDYFGASRPALTNDIGAHSRST